MYVTSLSAKEVLRRVYDFFRYRGESVEVKLSKTACALIADDSDHHRNRRGYMCYDYATIAKIGTRKWLVAFGYKGGHYPGDQYSADIVVVPFWESAGYTEETEREIWKRLENSTFFRNSFVVAMKDGDFATSSEEVLKRIKSVVGLNKTQEEEYNRDYIDPVTLGAVCTSAAGYHPKTVNSMYRMIFKFLRERG